jgi:hypothetical protein
MSLAVRVTRRAVRAASAIRGERVIHAKGEAFTATLEILDGAERLDVPLVRGPRVRDAVVRFSRGAGLPDAMPDVLGLAVRVPDADGVGGVQDLLLSTSRRPPLFRHVPWPARDLLRSTYSSLTMFDIGGDRLLVGACGANGTHGARRPTDLPGGMMLLATAPARGPWEPFARLVVGERLAGERELDFSPANDAGGFVAAGPFREARVASYPASRAVESTAAQRR